MTRQLMLEGQGYRVTSALGFTEAEAQCQRGGFDLLVLGHSIPSKDKQALVAHFRANNRAPIVSLLRAGEPFLDAADHHISPDDPRGLLQELTAILPPQVADVDVA